MKIVNFLTFIMTGLCIPTAQAAVGVQGSLVRAVEVKSGQTIQIPITLTNASATQETVKITIEDVRVLPGGTTYLQPGQLSRSNAAWVKLPATAFTIAANTTKTFNVSITVPDAAGSGAYWSALIVQPDRLPTQGKGGVLINTRYAVNLITTLPGGAPKVRIANPSLHRTEQGVGLNVQFFNEGTASTVPGYRAEVYDAQGKLVAKNDVSKMRLYPAGGVKVGFNFGKLPAGKYTFLVMANDGVNPVTGTKYTVNVGN